MNELDDTSFNLDDYINFSGGDLDCNKLFYSSGDIWNYDTFLHNCFTPQSVPNGFSKNPSSSYVCTESGANILVGGSSKGDKPAGSSNEGEFKGDERPNGCENTKTFDEPNFDINNIKYQFMDHYKVPTILEAFKWFTSTYDLQNTIEIYKYDTNLGKTLALMYSPKFPLDKITTDDDIYKTLDLAGKKQIPSGKPLIFKYVGKDENGLPILKGPLDLDLNLNVDEQGNLHARVFNSNMSGYCKEVHGMYKNIITHPTSIFNIEPPELTKYLIISITTKKYYDSGFRKCCECGKQITDRGVPTHIRKHFNNSKYKCPFHLKGICTAGNKYKERNGKPAGHQAPQTRKPVFKWSMLNAHYDFRDKEAGMVLSKSVRNKSACNVMSLPGSCNQCNATFERAEDFLNIHINVNNKQLVPGLERCSKISDIPTSCYCGMDSWKCSELTDACLTTRKNIVWEKNVDSEYTQPV